MSLSAASIIMVNPSVLALDLALIPLCADFVMTMAAQGFVFGNASALLGPVQVVAIGASAPLASSGCGASAVPMVVVMLVGITGAWCAFILAGRGAPQRRLPEV